MGYADVHIHTIYSVDGTTSPAAVLKYAANHTSLDVIAITDHDELRGSLEACNMASKYAMEVIPGVEITSRDGHILALWVEKHIPAGLSAAETINQIGRQGGLAIAAHPMAKTAHGLSASEIRKIVDDPDLSQVMIGIETYNAGLIFSRETNEKTRKLAENLPLARLGNSDAHTPRMIGGGQTEFPGTTAQELRQALLARTTRPVICADPSSVQILGEWALLYLPRLCGFAWENQAPEQGISLSRSRYPYPNLRELFSGYPPASAEA